MGQKFYAVKQGRAPGIYFDWDTCSEQVDGYKNAIYKSFKSLDEAATWLGLDAGVAANALKAAETEIAVSDKKIPEPDPGSAIAYVDGSFSEASEKFSYGIVLFVNTLGLKPEIQRKDKAFENHKSGDILEFHISKAFGNPELLEMRNVSGEIMGSAEAMKQAMERGCRKITIYHDYEGISKWPLGEWKTNKPWTEKYKEFYKNISKKIEIEFVKVKAHSKNTYNDMADELAKGALEA